MADYSEPTTTSTTTTTITYSCLYEYPEIFSIDQTNFPGTPNTCDGAWVAYGNQGLDCYTLSNPPYSTDYGIDCTGCACPGDNLPVETE